MITKSKIWLSIEKRRNNFERRFSLLARKVLNGQFAEVSSRIDLNNYNDPNLVSLFVTKEPIEKLFGQIYVSVGGYFANEEFSRLKGLKRKSEETWYEEMMDYVRLYCAKKVTSITMTSRELMEKLIQGAIDQAVSEGLGASATADYIIKALRKEGAVLNKWRALRIARTEVMTASNRGALVGGIEAGATKKYWIATYDNRTRDTHKVMESQNPKLVDEDFLVGLYPASGPGDSRLPAEEVINCRCALALGM